MTRVLYVAGQGEHPVRHAQWARRLKATRAAVEPLLVTPWELVELEDQRHGSGVSAVIAEVTLWDWRVDRVIHAAEHFALPVLALYLSTLPGLSEGKRPESSQPYRAAHNAAALVRQFLGDLPEHPPVNLLAPPIQYAKPPRTRGW